MTLIRLVFVALNLIVFSLGQLRLPGNVTPSDYAVELNLGNDLFIGDGTVFTGKVRITFKVNTSTDEIRINSLVAVTNASLRDFNVNQVPVSRFDDFNSATQIVTIVLGQPLTPGVDYLLELSFNGTIRVDNNIEGIFRADYLDESGKISHILATQFELNFAREVFPSFDEYRYKATFTITVIYPSQFNILSNTPIKSTEIFSPGLTRVTFEKTPIMSTYLVALAVGNFTCTELSTDIDIEVCSLATLEQYRGIALEVLPSVVSELKSITGIPYSSFLPKITNLALPAFVFNGYWGLTISRDLELLCDENETQNADLQACLTTIFQEISHQWFGDLVTPSDWDYFFLKEALSELFMYFRVPNAVEKSKTWQLDKQFYAKVTQWGLLADSFDGAPSLNGHVDTQYDILEKLTGIMYEKGAPLYRMFQLVIGESNFFAGLKSFIKDHVEGVFTPDDLWNALSPFFPNTDLPSNESLATVIKNWTDLPGHPVVTLTASGNDVIVTQRRFSIPDANYETEWYIPISYTLSSDNDKFSDTSAMAWLVPGRNLTLKGVLGNNDWIIGNNKASGFYRVNYDDTLWGRIQAALSTDLNQIDVLNRAQIAYDVLSFASSGLMNYSQALDIASFLKNETEYFAWYPVIASLNRLVNRIGAESSTGVKLAQYYLKLLDTAYRSLNFDDNDDHVYGLKQNLILSKVCWLGENSCVKKSKELYAAFKNGAKVPKNVRGAVYCTALKFSDDPQSDYDFLFSYLKSTTLPSERYLVINNIGCLTDSVQLKRFLNETLNPLLSGLLVENFQDAWASVYATEKIGTDAAMEFLADNYDRISSYLPGEISSLILGIAGRFFAQDQLDRLEAFANLSNLSQDDREAANSALESARSRIANAVSISVDLDIFLDAQLSYYDSNN